VLDRVNGVAYVALSERADRELAEQWVSHCWGPGSDSAAAYSIFVNDVIGEVGVIGFTVPCTCG
jgi:hypothetical protein